MSININIIYLVCVINVSYLLYIYRTDMTTFVPMMVYFSANAMYNREISSPIEYCTAHMRDSLVILVPAAQHRTAFLHTLLAHRNRTVFSVIFLVLISITLLRIGLRCESWMNAIVRTVGIFFWQSAETRPLRRTSEYLWTVTMFVFAFYASIILSSSIFAVVMTDNGHEIDTIQQLSAANLPVFSSTNSQELEILNR